MATNKGKEADTAKSESAKRAKKYFDINALKKPKFFVPIFVLAFILFSIFSLILWRPGIARGEYSIQAIVKMLLNQEIKTEDQQNKPSVVEANITKADDTDVPTPTSTPTVPTGTTSDKTTTPKTDPTPTPTPTPVPEPPVVVEENLCSYYQGLSATDQKNEGSRHDWTLSSIEAHYGYLWNYQQIKQQEISAENAYFFQNITNLKLTFLSKTGKYPNCSFVCVLNTCPN